MSDRVLEFGYGVVALAVGILVLWLGPGRHPNQALGQLLIVEGIGIGGIMAEMMDWGFMGPAFQYAANGTVVISAGLIPILYLNFIRNAIPGRIANVLKNPPLFVSLAILSVALTVARLGYFGPVFSGLPPWGGYALFAVPLVSAGLIGLAATITFVKAADGQVERRRAKAYLRAFISRDIGYVFVYGFYFLTYWWLPFPSEIIEPLAVVLLGICWFIFLSFLLYGILTGNVIDLDRKFRIGISNSTAAAAVAILFLVATEVMESMLGIAGQTQSVLAAVGLAFIFRPLQRLAERGATRLLPTTPLTAEDYQYALSRALEDGVITANEQRVLDELNARIKAKASAGKSP